MKTQTLAAFTLALLLNSCAHHIPASVGTGKPSNQEINSCTLNVLTIPFDSQKTKLNYIMKSYDIKPSEVFSVDYTKKYYLLDLLSEECTNITLNQSNPKKLEVLKAQAIQALEANSPNTNKESKTFDGVKINPNNPFKEELKKCDRFIALHKQECRKFVYKAYKN
ncbi:MAG: hypothetical protein CME60_01750 [Halobacteriovoraceae bacterium]|nr:hypothetical protein [Halobacteriovoraceae bacterium]